MSDDTLQSKSKEAYDRGVEAGTVQAELKEHKERLDKINGSMDRIADEMHDLVLAIRTIEDRAASDKQELVKNSETVKNELVATAENLRISNANNWKDFEKRLGIAARTGIVLLTVVLLGGLYLAAT